MMKTLRIFIYFSLTLLVICVPLYSGARILLPGWLKEYISSSLPSGSELQIGEMKSMPNMGVSYKNLVFINNKENFQINLQDIILKPNISISKPANFIITSGIIKTKEAKFSVKNLSGNIIVDSYKNKNVSILGNIKELKEVDRTIFNNIEFLINGIINNQKKINAVAENIDLKFLSPNGLVKLNLKNVNFSGYIFKEIETKIQAENLTVDLSEIGRSNPNRIIMGENVNLDFKFHDEQNWQMPLNFKAEKIKAIAGDIGSELIISGLGLWKNGLIKCELKEILSSKKECGKLIDVIQIVLKFKDLDKKGKFEFFANGYCVTPNAGCPQIIESSIRTKNTAEIISKTMISGIIDPILGGVILGALLSTPHLDDENFDHKAHIKVIGNKILLNGKPII